MPPGVNFTNILRAAFTCVSCACSFLCLRFRFVFYWCKPTGVKAVRRTLVKLTPVLMEVFRCCFMIDNYHTDSPIRFEFGTRKFKQKSVIFLLQETEYFDDFFCQHCCQFFFFFVNIKYCHIEEQTGTSKKLTLDLTLKMGCFY